MIAYPLFKLIGFAGSYILYFSLWAIGSTLVMNITLYDIIMYVKEKINNKISIKKSSKKEERKASKDFSKQDSLVEAVPEVKEREEFINGINNKIKILDFMKNSSLEDVKEESSNKLDNPFNIEVYDEENFGENKAEKEIIKETKGGKKEKLSNDVKEVINKEIESHINKEKIEEKIYQHPSVDLLNINSRMKLKSEDKKELIESAGKLEGILNDFGVDAKVIQVTKGPSVTRFEIQPSPGVKVSKIVNLQDDIALGLAASGVRMEAPIPGKAAIGIEVPNKKQTPVLLRKY